MEKRILTYNLGNNSIAKPINIGGQISGLIADSESNRFSIDLIAGQRYQFTLSTENSIEPTLELYDLSNELITPSSTTKSFVFRPSETGTYSLLVTDAAASVADYSYTLSADYERFSHVLNFTNPLEFGDNYDQVVACLNAAVNTWADKIIQTGETSAVIDLDIIELHDDEGILAKGVATTSEWPYEEVFDGKDVYYFGPQDEITTGNDPNGTGADGKFWIDMKNPKWWFNPVITGRSDVPPIADDQYDFFGTILHEFAHVLGFATDLKYLTPPTGVEGLIYKEDWFGISNFDKFVVWNDDKQSFEFTGSIANETYHQLGYEGNLPLTSYGNLPGTDLQHYGNTIDLGNLQSQAVLDELSVIDFMLQAPSISQGSVIGINSLDLAVLQDLGYSTDKSSRSFSGFSSDYHAIEGGDGLDLVTYSTESDKVIFSASTEGQILISDTEVFLQYDTLTNIERLEFANKGYALDIAGNAGIAARVIVSAFGADKISNLMSSGLSIVDSGMNLSQVCYWVVDMNLIDKETGSSTNGSFVDHVYENVVGTAPSSADHDTYTALLDNGTYTKSSLLELAANTTLAADIMTASLVDLIGVAGSADGEFLAIQYDVGLG